MNISDEELAAYVSGELDAAERARIEQALKRDARLARRLAHYRSKRAQRHSAFDGALRQPLSRRLSQTVRSAAPVGSAQIIDLARVRAERKRRGERQRTLLGRPFLIGASLIIGLALGMFTEHLAFDGGLTEYRAGALLARGSLDAALDGELASTASPANAVRVGMSFRAKSGNYCRTFFINDGPALSGLACREQARWQVVALIGAEANPVRPHAARSGAAGLPPPLLQAVNQRMSGEPLDAQAEGRARSGGWR